MSKTPYFQEQQMRLYIEKLIKKIPPEGFRLNTLVVETLFLFPVSERSIRHFIELAYIEPGIIYEKNGILYKKGE